MLCYGASGTGSQVAYDLRHQAGPDAEFLGYIDDVQDPRRTVEPDARVFNFEEILELDDIGVFVAIHNPVVRREIFARLNAHRIPILGSRGSPHLVHPLATIGEGSILSSSTRIGFSTRLGAGVVGFSDLIAHDVEVGDFTTLAYGSIVLGHVTIGAGVFIGAGAVIKNGSVTRQLTIGDGAIIDAGAIVGSNVPAGTTMMAPHARPTRPQASRDPNG